MMESSQFLWPVFAEHVGSASVVPFVPSITLEAMALFGGYNLPMFALVALAGLVGGCLLNWLLGRGFALLRARVRFLGRDTYPKAQRFMQHYGVWACALFWLPFGALLPLAAGFLSAAPWKVALSVALGALYVLLPFISA